MEEQNRNITMLELLQRPAFCVEDGCIRHINQSAAKYLLSPGTHVASLVLSGKQEYSDFSGGSLYVTLQLGEDSIGACVTRMDQQDIFVLEEPESASELRALALAAKELREPLAGILTVSDKLSANTEHAAQMNRRLFQIMRLVSNMSDAFRYSQQSHCRMEYVQVSTLFDEIFTRAGELLQSAGLRLRYTGLAEAIYTLADGERLERAVYNILSNAAKFSPKNGTIQAKLSRKGNRLYLSVTDAGPGIHVGSKGSLFTRFQREPGLEDIRNGIGLGMVLVRSTASLHGGAVLIDQPDGVGTRTTMTLEIRQSKDTLVRTPAIRIDYAGEWDHGLLELADCLPAELYQNL